MADSTYFSETYHT